MPITAVLLFIIAFFLGLKAVEHRGHPPMYPAMSWGAWLFFAVGVVVTLIHIT